MVPEGVHRVVSYCSIHAPILPNVTHVNELQVAGLCSTRSSAIRCLS